MRKSCLVLFFLCLVPAAAQSSEAEVLPVTTDCQDYFVVGIGNSRYALLEWYGGYRPEKGDVLSGDFSHFGVQDMMVKSERLRVYVEDSDLSQEDISDKLAGKCS